MSEKAKKKGFKMPHLIWLMTGMLLVCSLLTYIIPAGQFAVDSATGAILGNEFNFLGHQTPVSPVKALLDIFPGLNGSAYVVLLVIFAGGCMQPFLEARTFDKMIDWAIYKMNGKGDMLLIGVMFCLMVYLGAFGGGDQLVALVPIGVAFAKSMKLDGFVAMSVTTFATLIGFGTGPTKLMISQSMMGTRIYGGAITRFVFMNIFMIAGLMMVLSYVKKIKKNPAKSMAYGISWNPETEEEVDQSSIVKKVEIGWREVIGVIIFFGQYVYFTWFGLTHTDFMLIYANMAATLFITGIIQGVLGRMSADQIGNAFGRGFANMALVGIVIGMARSVSLVLSDGNILHTMVYFITRPLMALPRWISSVGMTLVISVINVLIPSASSKTAILIPIIKPIGEVLQLQPEVVVQAFQFGDGFTNIVSPILGWTVGSVATAGLDFGQWLKWAIPKVLIFLLLACVLMVICTVTGWTFAL